MKMRSTAAIAAFFAVALSPVPSALFPTASFGEARAENSNSNDHGSDKDKGKSGKDKDKSDKDNGNSGKDNASNASGKDKDKPDHKQSKADHESDKDRDGWKGNFRDAAKVAFSARVDLVKAYEQVIDARNLLNVDRAALQAAIDAGVDTTDAQAAVDADRAALIKALNEAAVAEAKFDAARALERVRLLIAIRDDDCWDDGPLWDGDESGSNGSETGKLASELKGLNSSHASASALAHASDKSQVGKNGNYLDAATVTVAARADLAKAIGALGDARATLATDQATLDAVIKAGGDTTEAQAAVDADTRALNGARYDVVVAEAQLDAAKAREHVALLIATDGEDLSPEALEEYRANLGL